jgi:hypothetical protein
MRGLWLGKVTVNLTQNARLVDVFQTYLEVRVNLPDVSHYRQVIVHEGGAV